MNILRPANGPPRDPEGIHQVPRSGPLPPEPDLNWRDPDGAEGDVEFSPDELLGDRPDENPQACPVSVEGIVETHDTADPRWNGTTYDLTGNAPVRIVNAYPSRSSVLLVNVGATTVFLADTDNVSVTSAFRLLAGQSITIPTRADVWACGLNADAIWSVSVLQTFRDG